MATIPSQGRHTTKYKGAPTSAPIVVVPSLGSQPTPPAPEQVGVEGSTKLKALQHALDGADPPRSSSGHNTTTSSQKNQPEETVVNDGTAASESHPASSEWVVVANSEAEKLKASHRALRSTAPPHSSSGHGTTTNSQSAEPEKVNVGTASSEPPPGQVETEGSTTEPHAEADTSPRSTNDSAEPLQSFGGLSTDPRKEIQSAKPEETLVNGGAPSSDSQPEHVGVEDSTGESRAEANMSRAPQGPLEKADPPQSSGGLDTSTNSQKELQSTEPEKTRVTVSTASSNSPPLPKQAEDLPVKLHSEADTSDPNPPQSSTALGTTTIPQTEPRTAEPKMTQMDTTDTGTPSPAKIPDSDSLENQSTNVNASTQASRCTSVDVKDHTVSGQLPTHVAHPDHRNGDVMNPNEESSTNSSQPSKGASTPSKKEKTEVNQLSQKEGLCSTEDTNKQKASDSTQAEDGQATTSSMEEDVDQPLAEYQEAIRGLKAKMDQQAGERKEEIERIEAKMHQQAGERKEEIERIEAKISSLEKIVDQQKREHKEEIEYFKARIPTKDDWLSMRHGVNTEHKREIERPEEKQEKERRLEPIVVATGKQTPEIEGLEGKDDKEFRRLEAIIVATDKQTSEEIDRLQIKISSMEHVVTEHKQEIERLEGKYDKEIQRLEEIVVARSKQTSEEIERLQTKISSMEHVAVEHKQEMERLEVKHDKEIRRLETMIMGKQTSGEIERLQSKVSSEEGAKQLKTKQARDPTKNPVEKPIDSSQPPQTHVAKHSSTVANQKIDGLDQEPGIKKEQNESLPHTSASGKQRNVPPPQAVAHKADNLSVTDVADLVKGLNAEIGQIVDLLTESLPKPEPPASDIAFDELHNYLGPWLCDKLQENSEPGSLITQLALQTGLANACSSVVNDPPFWCDGSILQALYIRMVEEESQAAADKWRAKTSRYLGYLDFPQFEDANKKYLTEVLLKLTTAVVGGTLKSNEGLLSRYNPQVEVIAKMAAKLHMTITEDVTSSELITFTVPSDTEFDASQMEDTETNHGSTPHGKVVCTHDMGLLCRKRVEPKKPRGSLKDWGTTMKAKVVLAATLEG